MKIVFFGSDNFSLVIAASIINKSHTIEAIVTGPDIKKGRGQQPYESLLKEFSRESNILCMQPDVLSGDEVLSGLKKFDSVLFLIVSYGRILPPDILHIPKFYCINIHPSLLPKYRGPSPVPYTLLNGDTETGFTIIKLNEKVDCGDIIYQEKITIDNGINSMELIEKIAQCAGRRLGDVLDDIESGKVRLTKQDEASASYAPFLEKKDGLIDWNTSCDEVHNKIRALIPWPSAYTYYNGKMLKIYKSICLKEKIEDVNKSNAGTVVEINKQGWITVKVKDGFIRLLDVQYEGKRRMNAHQWAIGQRLEKGEGLG